MNLSSCQHEHIEQAATGVTFHFFTVNFPLFCFSYPTYSVDTLITGADLALFYYFAHFKNVCDDGDDEYDDDDDDDDGDYNGWVHVSVRTEMNTVVNTFS